MKYHLFYNSVQFTIFYRSLCPWKYFPFTVNLKSTTDLLFLAAGLWGFTEHNCIVCIEWQIKCLILSLILSNICFSTILNSTVVLNIYKKIYTFIKFHVIPVWDRDIFISNLCSSNSWPHGEDFALEHVGKYN